MNKSNYSALACRVKIIERNRSQNGTLFPVFWLKNVTIFFNQIQIAPLISDNLKPNRSLGESFYSFLNNNVVPLYIVHWLHLSCFYDNCVILDLQRLSNRRHTSCLLTFLKVTYEKLDLQVQLVWIWIHVISFLWECGKKLRCMIILEAGS